MDEITELISHALKQGAIEKELLSSIRHAISAATTEAQKFSATVFLSYASTDRDIVRQVASGLTNAGIRVWFDEFSLKPGSEWVREIERGLDAADFIVFFISPNSVGSGWAQKELQIALHRQISGESEPMIYLFFSNPLPFLLLRDIQWLDMTDKSIDQAVDEIVDAIKYFADRKRLDR